MKSLLIPQILISLLLLTKIIQTQPTASDSCIKWNTNYSVCTRCLPGLYLQFFFCIPCNPMCICSNNTNYCQTCLNITIGQLQYSSYRVGDICILCNETIPFCLQCIYNNNITNNNNNIICLKCVQGTYVLQNGLCSNVTQVCMANCLICSNITHCQLCYPGYYLDKNYKCQIVCTVNCTLCHNQTSCKLCEDGFYQNLGLCEPCISDCLICDNNQTCIDCIPGYLFFNGSCQNTQLSNCVQYTGGFQSPTCLVCQPGYYNLQGNCNQCNGCALCTQFFLCQTQCQEGYNRFNFACLQSQKILSIFVIALIFFISLLLI